MLGDGVLLLYASLIGDVNDHAIRISPTSHTWMLDMKRRGPREISVCFSDWRLMQ